MNSMNFMNCHQLWTVEKRKWKRQNENGREAYKDVRPAPLDVRQCGTPELGFSFAKDVSLFRGNLFRACRSVRSELRSLERTNERPEAESGYARCQILRAIPFPSHLSWRRRPAPFSIVLFLLWPSCPLFTLIPSFLSFSLSLSVSALSAVERSFNRKSYGSLASASASANTQLILRRRAKGRILARSQTFPSRTGRAKREPETEFCPIVSQFSV